MVSPRAPISSALAIMTILGSFPGYSPPVPGISALSIVSKASSTPGVVGVDIVVGIRVGPEVGRTFWHPFRNKAMHTARPVAILEIMVLSPKAHLHGKIGSIETTLA
jgi:hypothetical protein